MNALRLFGYGAFGALVPDVLLLYSKRFTAPLLAFESWQVLLVTLIYAITAGLVAQIFPYPGEKTPWKSLAVGITLPVIIAGVIGAGDRLSQAGTTRLSTRGPTPAAHGDAPKIQGSVIDLMALL